MARPKKEEPKKPVKEAKPEEHENTPTPGTQDPLTSSVEAIIEGLSTVMDEMDIAISIQQGRQAAMDRFVTSKRSVADVIRLLKPFIE